MHVFSQIELSQWNSLVLFFILNYMCIDVEGDTGYLSNVIGRYKALSCKKHWQWYISKKEKIKLLVIHSNSVSACNNRLTEELTPVWLFENK